VLKGIVLNCIKKGFSECCNSDGGAKKKKGQGVSWCVAARNNRKNGFRTQNTQPSGIPRAAAAGSLSTMEQCGLGREYGGFGLGALRSRGAFISALRWCLLQLIWLRKFRGPERRPARPLGCRVRNGMSSPARFVGVANGAWATTDCCPLVHDSPRTGFAHGGAAGSTSIWVLNP